MIDDVSPLAFNQRLLEFIDASPTPWHAVDNLVQALEGAGFQSIQATDTPAPGSAVYVRAAGAVVAAITPANAIAGWRLVGAHTDSPNLRFKPNALYLQDGYLMASVETYGGVLMNPWFDRELGLAGRAVVVDASGARVTRLFDSERAVAMVPSLAIHLDREANKERTVNAEQHLNLVLGQGDDVPTLTELLMPWGLEHGDRVLAADVCAYPVQPSDIIGLAGEWLLAPRLDNLLSCFAGLQALLTASETAGEVGMLLVCNDHEEIGSQSTVGADGPLLAKCLDHWGGDWERVVEDSMMVSADNAHGLHPNYIDKHSRNQQVVLNAGPVLKVNANQRYASEPETLACMVALGEALDIPLQQFANRADLGCGSTIGPITASKLGVRTLDIGAPTFAMHSTRETAGHRDPQWLAQLLCGFYRLHDLGQTDSV
ncbi:M18 family aminopeptidase [Litorivicinus lipolyticus]|uniref:M18 family aminopeptidase n=1 Tax=Litorivicinus lipolyticus TaxID=418701 RepID=UPI001FE91411|nr:M18 family aminopeptidase [Litorivicinus lipolyticus]